MYFACTCTGSVVLTIFSRTFTWTVLKGLTGPPTPRFIFVRYEPWGGHLTHVLLYFGEVEGISCVLVSQIDVENTGKYTSGGETPVILPK